MKQLRSIWENKEYNHRMQVQENYKRLKEQFLYGIKNEIMRAETIKDVTAIKDIAKVKVNNSSYRQNDDSPKSQIVILESIRDKKRIWCQVQNKISKHRWNYKQQ